MISVETQKKINQLLPLVTAEKLERWMEWSLAGVIPPTFKPELTSEEGRYTENAIVKKESSYTNGKYSLSIWRVQNCHEKNVSLSLQGILEDGEVSKLETTHLPIFGETKLVIIKKRKKERMLEKKLTKKLTKKISNTILLAAGTTFLFIQDAYCSEMMNQITNKSEALNGVVMGPVGKLVVGSGTIAGVVTGFVAPNGGVWKAISVIIISVLLGWQLDNLNILFPGK